MPNTIYANARASALTASLLGAERLSRMADCASPADAMKILGESGFGGGTATDAEELVEAEERAYTAFVRETAPEERLARFLLAGYDCRNLEAAVRAKHLKRPVKDMAGADGFYPLSFLEEKVFSDEYSSFPAPLKSALAAADGLFVLGSATGRAVNTLFSRAKFLYLTALAAGDKLLSGIVSYKADAVNVGIALRARSAALAADMAVGGGLLKAEEIAFLAEESAENSREKFRFSPRKEIVFAALEDFAAGLPLLSLERMADNAALALLQDARYQSDGYLPFFRYCCRKAAEIGSVRLIIACLAGGADKAALRMRLRETV